MEHQGKTKKQVTDSELFAFWGIVGLVTCVLFLLLTPSSNSKLKEELKEAKFTIERLKKSHDSLQWKHDSIWGEEMNNTRMLNRYQVAYEIFLRRDPQGAKIYGDIISDETE